jgi:citrate lyase subunit beta/citryl-CoA lyase
MEHAMDKLQRTFLMTTCAKEDLMVKQRDSAADIACLELDDGVPFDLKDEARRRALAALKEWDYGGKDRWVRINRVDTLDGMRDLMTLVEGRPQAISLSKPRTANDIVAADYLLSRREEELGLPVGGIKLYPMIETGDAFLNLRSLITASGRVAGVLFGSEDLSADIGIVRTAEGYELDYARGMLIMIAKSLGVKCFDASSVLLRDPQALYRESRRSYHLGFDGKGCISPSQIDVIHRAFSPSEEDVDAAERLVVASRAAAAKGLSVFEHEGRMIDSPFVLQAEHILRQAGRRLPA